MKLRKRKVSASIQSIELTDKPDSRQCIHWLAKKAVVVWIERFNDADITHCGSPQFMYLDHVWERMVSPAIILPREDVITNGNAVYVDFYNKSPRRARRMFPKSSRLAKRRSSIAPK